MTPDDLVAAARAYLGTPFQHQGRTRKGIDCQGLLVCAGRDLGLDMSMDRANYGTPNAQELLAVLGQHARRLPLPAPSGAVLVFVDRRWVHLGLSTPRGVIHALEGKGVVEHGLRAPWGRRLKAAFAFPGVTYG